MAIKNIKDAVNMVTEINKEIRMTTETKQSDCKIIEENRKIIEEKTVENEALYSNIEEYDKHINILCEKRDKILSIEVPSDSCLAKNEDSGKNEYPRECSLDEYKWFVSGTDKKYSSSPSCKEVVAVIKCLKKAKNNRIVLINMQSVLKEEYGDEMIRYSFRIKVLIHYHIKNGTLHELPFKLIKLYEGDNRGWGFQYALELR